MSPPSEQRPYWEQSLRDLCDILRDAVRGALVSHTTLELATPVRAGAGDVTFALDEITERAVEVWAAQQASERPFSLLTEDSGWRHFGPDRAQGPGDPFDHGGPRIALDPIDGTRNVMADLRPAWTVVSYCEPGPGQPSLGDVCYGLLSEIPNTGAGRFRRVWARAGEPCWLEERGLAASEPEPAPRRLEVDGDDRPDRGYFPFFRYDAALRPSLATLEAVFFSRLAAREGADIHHCFDDQWCCGAGQLVALMGGTYRMLVDLRGRLGERLGLPATTGHPYDVAGAILCARSAGCVVNDADGAPIDFPIDCTTPLDIVAWTNEATRARLEPHLVAAREAVEAALESQGESPAS